MTLLAYAPLAAQSLQIYSEFQRVDPFGEVLAVDRSPNPREIISPAVARNAFASFHIAVGVPPGGSYFLYVQSNPPGILETRLYKEQFVHSGRYWIPDILEETRTPCFGVIPDGLIDISGQTSRDYLLDIWVPPDAEVGRRVRVEVLLKFGSWTVVPMEIRIMRSSVPARSEISPAAPLPPIDAPSDAEAVDALVAYLAGLRPWSGDEAVTVRNVLRRNAEQDMALAGVNPSPAIWLLSAAHITNAWTFFPAGAEWYLRIRDLLISRPRP